MKYVIGLSRTQRTTVTIDADSAIEAEAKGAAEADQSNDWETFAAYVDSVQRADEIHEPGGLVASEVGF